LKYEEGIPDKLEFTVQSSAAGILEIKQSYHTGWKVKLNGHSIPLLKINYFNSGFLIPRGKSDILLDFNPLGFRVGLGISFISLLIILIIFGFSFKSKTIS